MAVGTTWAEKGDTAQIAFATRVNALLQEGLLVQHRIFDHHMKQAGDVMGIQPQLAAGADQPQQQRLFALAITHWVWVADLATCYFQAEVTPPREQREQFAVQRGDIGADLFQRAAIGHE